MYRIFALFMSLFFGATFSQLPEYGQQYRQRLAGAIDELSALVRQFDKDARSSGLTRDQALDHYRKAGDRFLEKRGADMSGTIARLDRLQAQQRELTESVGIARLVPLATHVDADIGRRALAEFEPAAPLTTEGLGLTAIGLLFGRLLAPIFGLFVGRRPGRRTAAPVADGNSESGAGI